MFSFASNRPRNFGVYLEYSRIDIRELIANYEEDFNEACSYMDAEHLTRFAQAFYLFKDDTFENVWWRVENRVHDLAEEKGALDLYHLTNIVRSFSRSQQNKLSGSEKLFRHLEPLILQNLDKTTPRDLSHIVYSYSVRNAGNPELYKAFFERIHYFIDQGDDFDYPTMFNLIYFLLFRDSKDERIWSHIINSTLNQDDMLPIVYYKPFKYSKLWLEAHFKDWDISSYVERFWYAEQYFNQA